MLVRLMLFIKFILLVSGAMASNSDASETTIDLNEDPKVLVRVDEQEKGEYGKLSREDKLIPLGEIQEAWDHADETAGIYKVNYDPGKNIRLRIRQQMSTIIRFPDWEEIEEVYLGDNVVFGSKRTKDNILVVFAKYAGSDTSLQVIGKYGNVYSFYLRSEGVHSSNVSDMTVFIDAVPPIKKKKYFQGEGVSFKGNEDHSYLSQNKITQNPKYPKESYPIVKGKKLDREDVISLVALATESKEGYGEEDFIHDIEFKEENIDFHYMMHGDKSIAPQSVFNDGLFTYLYYGDSWDHKDMPTIYRVVDDIDVPVNYRIKGPMIVIEKIGNLTIKNGAKYTCIKQSKGRSSNE